MLYFIRHGQSVANLQKVFAGSRVDSPLTNTGRIQAEKVAQNILDSGIKFDRIISSPLIRAQETAQIVAQKINFKKAIELDDRIKEYDMGDCSGKPYQKVDSLSCIGRRS